MQQIAQVEDDFKKTKDLREQEALSLSIARLKKQM
jgi:hypothetical protein